MRKILSVLLTLALCLSLAVPALAAFSDVPEGAYYADAVAWAVENGVTTGVTAATFAPEKTCTRGEIITFLWRAAGKPAPAKGANPYSDVPAGQFYTDAVLWAAEKGIAEADSTFSPNAPCTRAMAVTFLWKNAGSPVIQTDESFTDVPQSASYAPAVAWAVERGVTTGTTTTTFSPQDTCTRAQIVTFLYRAMAPIPTDEYQRAVWYRFLPEDLKTANPDSTTVTWKQFCAMLGSMIRRYDASKLPSWEKLTAGAPSTAMKRDGAMISLTFAAEQLGLLETNIRDSYFDFLYPGGARDWKIESYDWAGKCSFDYPVFPWDSPTNFDFNFCSRENYVAPSYFYCTQRVSGLSGLQIIAGGDECDFRLDQPLTLRDAMLAVVRLYESDYKIAKDVKDKWDRLDYSSEYKQVLAEADALRESILNDTSTPEITGTTYYVSNSGSDANDGLTPATAWATPEKVSTTKLNPGDGVLFERGSVFRGPYEVLTSRDAFLECQPGVTYGAYGTGPKPVLMGSPESGADPAKWSLYGETPDGGKVWVFYRDMRDCGTIVLDNGGTWTKKVRPNWDGNRFVNDGGSEFDVLAGLDQDLMFFSPADSLLRQPPVNADRPLDGIYADVALFEEAYKGTSGALYLRCDEGNPGEVFESIEFSICPTGAGAPLVNLCGGCVFDNICVTCTSDCGFFSAYDEEPRVVQNCEISFCGGGTLYYFNNGTPEVAGEGINQEMPLTLEHCYLHDTGDSGISITLGDSEENTTVHDITLTDNLFERTHNGIFMRYNGDRMKERGNVYRDITIENNYILESDGGWSNNFHSFGGSCLLYGGDSTWPLYGENMVIRNNVFQSSSARSLIYGACDGYEPPQFENNKLFLPPFCALNYTMEDGVAVVLWTNENGSPEDGTDWLWLYAHNCDDFLNGFLGSGNTVQTMK